MLTDADCAHLHRQIDEISVVPEIDDCRRVHCFQTPPVRRRSSRRPPVPPTISFFTSAGFSHIKSDTIRECRRGVEGTGFVAWIG